MQVKKVMKAKAEGDAGLGLAYITFITSSLTSRTCRAALSRSASHPIVLLTALDSALSTPARVYALMAKKCVPAGKSWNT